MDRYQRVEKPREEEPISENEVRVTAHGRMRNYISYATSLLQEKGSSEIVFKAMGRAINKAVMIVELIKRRIFGLHQITSIGSIDITDTWEPLEEGLLPLETIRHVSVITMTLSKKELDESSVGYQCPLPSDQVIPSTEFNYDGEVHAPVGKGRGGRGRGRARGKNNMVVDYENGGWDNQERRYARGGRSRSRGRGSRVRGMGGSRGDYQHEVNEGYGMRGGYGGSGGYRREGGRGHEVEGNDGWHNYHEPGGYDDGSFAAPQGQGWDVVVVRRRLGRGGGRGRGRGRSSWANGPINGGVA